MPSKLLKNIMLFGILIIGLSLISVLFVKSNNLQRQLDELAKSSPTRSEIPTYVNSAIRDAMVQERPLTDLNGQFVYLPELRIKMPASAMSKSLMYSMRIDSGVGASTDPTEADVSSSYYLPPARQTTYNCSDLVRLKIENDAAPYSPSEKPTAVKLKTGKTLQVYEATNHAECATSWQNSVSPAQIVDTFKKAEAY